MLLPVIILFTLLASIMPGIFVLKQDEATTQFRYTARAQDFIDMHEETVIFCRANPEACVDSQKDYIEIDETLSKKFRVKEKLSKSFYPPLKTYAYQGKIFSVITNNNTKETKLVEMLLLFSALNRLAPEHLGIGRADGAKEIELAEGIKTDTPVFLKKKIADNDIILIN